MRTSQFNRIVAFLLAALFLFAGAPAAFAADTEGFRCEKSATANGDGTYRISLRAFQTANVPAADIVMVLDVSGSMENSTPVPVSEIDGTKDYYIRYIRILEMDGDIKNVRVNVRVHNTAAAGETPVWVGQLEENGPLRTITPGDGRNGTYQFYTGAMDALRAAATEFVHSIAQNAVQYGADHRIAVTEFSSPDPKGTDALCTHTTQPDPYYANILTGDGTASGALVSAKDCEQELSDVFASLTAAGPTYSDDAMTQAKRILSASTAKRRVTILFTDGGPGSYGWEYDADDSAYPTANGAIAAAAEMKRSGVQIYTIGVFNEENLAGATGEKNRTYLSLLSSNYPDAASLDEPGTQQADGYCSVGDLHMDLSGAFAGISAVLGEPVESAQVRDTVSEYFFLTDAQRQALLDAYPAAQIAENDDGTTTVSLDNVDFPPVAIRANGEVADENDAGIFNMTFDVTTREAFLGGDGVSTNSGLCGVFAAGVQIAQFTVPTVSVPVNETALDDMLTVTPQTVYTDETITAQMLYTDHAQDAAADYADISYIVTDPEGETFTAQSIPTAGTYTFTVTMCAELGGKTYTRQKTVDVTVIEDTVDRLEILTPPAKTQYFIRQSVETDGLELCAHMRSGRTVMLTAEQYAVSPDTLTEPGTQTVTCTFGGASASFDVTVELYAPTLTLKAKPDKTTYKVRETLDTAGLTLVYTDEYGDALTVTEGFTCDTTTLAAIGTQSVTVTYKGLSVTFDVTAEPYTPTLTLEALPDRTTYKVRETLDTAGLTLVYTDEYGDALTVTEGFTCNIATLAAIGTQTVTVTYKGLSVTFDVTAEPYTPTLTLEALPDRTTYKVRETLDTAGLTLVYTDEYGDALTVTEGFTCDTTTLAAIGTQSVTVTYKGLSVTFDVTAEPYTPTLTLAAKPDKTTYFVGGTLDTAGLTLVYTDEYGDALTVTEGFTCDTTTLAAIGTQTVSVTYKGLSVTFDVTAEPYATTLTLAAKPDKTTYFVGGTLDTAGLTLVYTDEYGDALTVTEGFTCDTTTFTAIGTQTVSVTYKGLSVTFDVTVREIRPVSAQVVTLPHSTTFIYRRTPDFDGLSVRVSYNDGSEQIVRDLSQMTVRPESDARVRRGQQTYCVTTQGVSATFTMQVRLTVWQWLILILLFGWIWY